MNNLEKKIERVDEFLYETNKFYEELMMFSLSEREIKKSRFHIHTFKKPKMSLLKRFLIWWYKP